jgi:superfamily II DNA or RNA helicase
MSIGTRLTTSFARQGRKHDLFDRPILNSPYEYPRRHWELDDAGQLVAVPSLALIRQGVTDWTREFLANGKVPDWICVCSDETAGNLERDDFVGEVYELGLPTHTDPKKIASLLRAPYKTAKIVFTTYQSSDKLAAAARRAGVRFDLAILDEAHKTVGVRSKVFATLLRDRKLKARHRLFMTATERVFRGDNDDVLSMDNENDYGKCFFQLSYKKAIEQRIISDYKVLTITVSDKRISELIAENRILNLHSRDLDEAEAQAVATGIALKRVFRKYAAKHAISFHRSIRAADRFREQQDVLNRLHDVGPRTTNLHISSKKTAGERSDLLREFVTKSRALMTNARCLTEGIDVSAIDCVVFADRKQSRIDIVQAAGRALRRFPGKDYGYILLPLVVPSKMEFEQFAETTAFRQIAHTITALSTQDERIADEFRAIEKGRIPTGKMVEIDGDVPVGMQITLGEFAEAISTRIWESVGRANRRKFEDARSFVRGLDLKSRAEWNDYCRSRKKPADIPAYPQDVYAEADWVSWGDWLGTGYVYQGLRQYRPFRKARASVRRLGFKSEHGWRKYLKSGKKPRDIPAKPDRVYAELGWAGIGDWLGTGAVSTHLRKYRSFKKARAFARGLGLKSTQEWRGYSKSGKPNDIPACPNRTYADDGWAGMGDWLGTGAVATHLRKYRSFKKARAFVRGLRLKSSDEWRNFVASNKLPADIPSNPNNTYTDEGWAGLGDWLGTGTVATHLRKYRPFKKARAFVRTLGLESEDEWHEYTNSGKMPVDIPAKPESKYARDGWIGFRDWLGTDTIASSLRQYRSFKKARSFVRSLGLKSSTEWRDYCKSGKKPGDIPAKPYRKYVEAGWAGYGDWLGQARNTQARERSQTVPRTQGSRRFSPADQS